MNIKLRTATENDLADIVRLLFEDPFANGREDFSNPLPAAYLQAFKAITEDKNNLLLIVENDLGVVGTLQVTFIPGISFQGATRALIEAIMVDSRCRNQGIGSQMLEFAIEKAKEKNVGLYSLPAIKNARKHIVFMSALGSNPRMKE